MQMSASGAQQGDETTYTVKLTNNGKQASLENKLTLFNKEGKRILPAYYSDNYVSLLPGESQTITVTVPTALVAGESAFALRGWNAIPQTVKVAR
jgi:archaellum component FlaF (FlaF/FlaG flagellin family)